MKQFLENGNQGTFERRVLADLAVRLQDSWVDWRVGDERSPHPPGEFGHEWAFSNTWPWQICLTKLSKCAIKRITFHMCFSVDCKLPYQRKYFAELLSALEPAPITMLAWTNVYVLACVCVCVLILHNCKIIKNLAAWNVAGIPRELQGSAWLKIGCLR